jgi:serine/threonine protein kinase
MNLLKFDPTMRMSAEEALKHEYFNDIKHMNPEMEKYDGLTTKILEFSLGSSVPLTEGRNSSSNPGIEHYRMLIEELEKFAERSTNRSGNAFINPPHEEPEQNIHITHDF